MPKKDTVTISKKAFQALHSAGRALFRQALMSQNHSSESLIYLKLLDEAIDEGHAALGTQRSFADRYVEVVGGITRVQQENAQKFMEMEGFTEKTQDFTNPS